MVRPAKEVCTVKSEQIVSVQSAPTHPVLRFTEGVGGQRIVRSEPETGTAYTEETLSCKKGKGFEKIRHQRCVVSYTKDAFGQVSINRSSKRCDATPEQRKIDMFEPIYDKIENETSKKAKKPHSTRKTKMATSAE